MRTGVLCIITLCLGYLRETNARPELRVRSLCAPEYRTATGPHSSSNKPGLNCDPCHYEIAVVTDNDGKSKSNTTENEWESIYAQGTLDVKAIGDNFSVTLGDLHYTILKSSISADGKGMELSDLISYDGHLLSFDDKTGTVYQIINGTVKVWITLNACPRRQKGFKSEWATVKDGKLIVGSAGFPWQPTSEEKTEPTDCGSQWIKVVDSTGKVENVNWKPMFTKLQHATRCKGYITHESVMWSAIRKRWYFAPRKCSGESFDAKTDSKKGSNILISADENFDHIEVVEVGEFIETRGFSSIKFLPHSDDTIIIALKTSETRNHTFESYLTVFGIDGEVFLPDTLFSKENKFEGIEFLED